MHSIISIGRTNRRWPPTLDHLENLRLKVWRANHSTADAAAQSGSLYNQCVTGNNLCASLGQCAHSHPTQSGQMFNVVVWSGVIVFYSSRHLGSPYTSDKRNTIPRFNGFIPPDCLSEESNPNPSLSLTQTLTPTVTIIQTPTPYSTMPVQSRPCRTGWIL